MSKPKLLTFIDPHTFKTIAYRDSDKFIISFRRKTGGKRKQQEFESSEIEYALSRYHKFIVDSDYMKYFVRLGLNSNEEIIYKERGQAHTSNVPMEFRISIKRNSNLGINLKKCNLRINILPANVIEAMDKQAWGLLNLPDYGAQARLVQYLLSYFFSLDEGEKKILISHASKAFADMAKQSEEEENFRLNDKTELL